MVNRWKGPQALSMIAINEVSWIRRGYKNQIGHDEGKKNNRSNRNRVL